MAIAVIRITGQVGLNADVKETLFRLRLRNKYNCIIMNDNQESRKILQKIRNFAAYGEISDDTLKKLVEARAEPAIVRAKVDRGKKVDANKIMEEISSGKIESIKPYFRLHPPRRGIKSKLHFPKGVLGDNGDKINKLIERML